MLYCDPCAKKNILLTTVRKVRGTCEICKDVADLSDLPQVDRSPPKPEPKPIINRDGTFPMRYCPSCWQQAGTPPVLQSTQVIVACGVCGTETICLESNVRLKVKVWPQRTIIYVHGSKESNYEEGRKLGLSEDACQKNFNYCCYELKVEVEVNEDGTFKIIGLKEK